MTAPLAALVERWDDLPKIPGRIVVSPAVRAFFLAGLAVEADGPLLAMVPGEREAEDLADDLELFTDRSLFLPAWETLPFEHVSPNVATMAQRAAARHALGSGEAGLVVVGSVRAVLQRVSPSPVTPVIVRKGESHDFEGLVEALVGAGYERTELGDRMLEAWA